MNPPTLSRAAFDDLLIDYLEGQLSEDVRQTFEQTMQAQPAWAEDVHALERTRQQARQTLKADERLAPARVRAHVLAEATKRAAVLREHNRIRNNTSVSQGHQSFFERLRKIWLGRPWFAPVLIAAAAVGLYVINQKSFDTTRARSVGQSSNVAQEAHPLPVASPAAPEATTPPSVADESASILAPQTKDDEAYVNGASKSSPRRAPGKSKRSRSVGVENKAGDANTIGKLLDDEGYAYPPPGWGGGGVAASAEALKASRAESSEAQLSHPQASAEQAAPVAKPSAPARSPARNPSAPTGASASARPSAPASSAGLGAGAPPMAERSLKKEAADAEFEEDAVPQVARRDSPWAGLSRADLATRAQRAEASGQWPLVIELYKELLRRHPQDGQAPAWKRQIVRAQQASQ